MHKYNNLQDTTTLTSAGSRYLSGASINYGTQNITVFLLKFGKVRIPTTWTYRWIQNSFYNYNGDAWRVTKYIFISWIDRLLICMELNSAVTQKQWNRMYVALTRRTYPHLGNTSSMKLCSHSCGLRRLQCCRYSSIEIDNKETR